MKITYEKLFLAYPALARLAERELPVSESVKVARLVAAFDPEAKIAHGQRIRIYEKYGERKGGDIYVPSEKRTAFEREIAELNRTEAEIPTRKITVKSDVRISAADVCVLSEFVEFEVSGE
jgi:intergrase/recombinase